MSKRDLGTRPLLAGTALVACLGLGLSQAQAAAAAHASRLGTAGAELDQLHSLTIENHALELQQRQLTNQLDWQVSQGRSGAGVEAVADRLQALSKADGALLEQEAGLARRIDGQLAGHVPPHLDTKLATITTEIGQNHAVDRREQMVVNRVDWRLSNARPLGTTEADIDGLQHLSAKSNSFGRTEERMTGRVDQQLNP